jgi:hypothetical protein
MPCSSCCTTAPDLVRRAIAAGVVVGWESDGSAYARIADDNSMWQRHAFEDMSSNRWTPDVLLGSYYAGDYRRMQ